MWFEVCIDQIEAQPPVTPYLTLYERKRPRLISRLRQFAEDLARSYRSEQRERERPCGAQRVTSAAAARNSGQASSARRRLPRGRTANGVIWSGAVI